MKDALNCVWCLVAGIGAALARIVYVFLPGFNVLDVLLFGALAAGLA